MFRTAALTMVFGFLVACGDDEEPSGGGGNGSGAAGPIPTEGSLFAVSSTVFTTDGTSSDTEVSIRPSLASEEVFQTLEITGPGSIFGIERQSRFFAALNESGNVRRYDLGEDGRIEPTGEIGFGAFGINSFFSQGLAFLSDELAVLIDNATLQAIRWNPTTMRIIGEPESLAPTLAPLAEADGGGALTLVLNPSGQRRDNGVVFFGYFVDNVNERLGASTVAIFVDGESGALAIDSDDRCGGGFFSAETSDGTLYVGPDPYATSLKVIDDTQPDACYLRVLAGENTFDRSFSGSATEVVANATIGGLAAGPGGSDAYVFALPQETAIPDATDFATRSELIYAFTPWSLRRIRLGDTLSEAEAPTGFDELSAFTGVQRVDGDSYLFVAAEDFSSTRFISTSTTAEPDDVGAVSGGVFGALRVR
ncbi:MAG: hypothetical protein AAF735_07305 [Myxococcota bacterium]